MRLGYHYHVPAIRGDSGRWRTAAYQGRFLDALAAHCETLVCLLHSPRPAEIPHLDYEIRQGNVLYVDLGPHDSVPRRLLRSGRAKRVLHKHRCAMDALLLRGPSPLLPALAAAAGPVPLALLLVGDYMAGIDALPQPSWRRELIRAWSWWNRQGQRRVARRALTMVNSRTLYHDLKPFSPHLVETRTTSLSRSDFYQRTDTCGQRPVRLLYTGRIHLQKGIYELVEVTARLRKLGQDVVLDLVGWAEPGDSILNTVRDLAQRRGVGSRVHYHGFHAVGPELSAFYRQADIYVLASRQESFPRTLWEAMAHGLPVVASAVGSIPFLLQHNETARLAEPANVDSLLDAILAVFGQPCLRRHLIGNGYRLAWQNTLERRTRELVETLDGWIDQRWRSSNSRDSSPTVP